MWKGAEAFFRGGDAHQFEYFNGALVALFAGELKMRLNRLLELKSDGKAGIETAHRLLKNHGNVVTNDTTALLFAHAEHVFTFKQHAVGGDRGGPG